MRLSFQSPKSPRAMKPAAAATAIRQPASTPAIAPTVTVTPSQVIRESTSCSRSTVELMPFFSGTRKCTNSGFVR